MKLSFTNVLGLKKALLVSFIITAFCCIASGTNYYYSSKTLYTNLPISYVDRAKDNSRLLSQIINEKLTALKLLAEDKEIQSMDWNKQKDDLMKHVKTLDVKRFRIIDKDGLSNSTDSTITKLYDREYFKKAINGIANISDVLRSRVDNSLIVVCATPIKGKNNKVTGVLSYTIDYQILSKIISDIKVGSEGYAVLIDNKGFTIAHPKKARILSDKTIFEQAEADPSLRGLAVVERKMIRGQTGYGLYKYYGINNFIAYAPVSGTNWFLGLTIPKSEVFSVINSLRMKFIFETFVLILIGLVLFYLILIYLSQRKKADENYKQFIEITELDRIKTEFFANVSHEFRTPLNVILGNVKLLSICPVNHGNIIISQEKFGKHLLSVKQNCYRLLRLINNLIDSTKIDSGYIQLNLKNYNIIKVVEDITLSVSQFIESRSLTITFDTDVEELIMACDADKIERVMLNLLSNAVKFTRPGGSIWVEIKSADKEVFIYVKDNGIGIPGDKLNIIFERFMQVDSFLTKENEGSGIGLSIVQSLIHMHGGKISVESEVGKGSMFKIRLPIESVNSEDAETEIKDDNEIKRIETVKIEFSDIYNS